MTILTTIPNGASYRDIRDTLNGVLARLLVLEGATPSPTPTPTPTPSPTPSPSPSPTPSPTPTPSATGLIFIATGDSKLVGVGSRDAEDVLFPNTYNVRSRDPAGVSQTLPYDQGIAPDGKPYVNPMEYFAKQVSEATGLPVYVIAHGWNGTAIMGANPSWGVGNSLHEAVVARCNGTGAYAGIGAVKAVMDARPGAVVAGLVRIEGTNDSLLNAGTFTKAQFLAATVNEDADFKARIFRNGVSGATIGDVPTFILGILPETLAANRLNSGFAVELALREAAATIANAKYLHPAEGYCQPDNLHETGAGVRYVGRELAKLRADPTAPVITTAGTGALADGQKFALELLADRYVFWSLSGPDAAKFEVYAYTDTTDSNITSSRVRFSIRFVGDVSKTYANPDDANADHVYDVTLNAKGGNGVVTTKQLLVTVEQAYGAVSTGPTDFAAGGYVNAGGGLYSPATLPAVAFGKGLNVMAFLCNPAMSGMTGVTVNGAAGTKIKAASESDPFEVWTVPIAKAGIYPVAVTFNGGNVSMQLTTGYLVNTVAAPFTSEVLPNGYHSKDYASSNITLPAGGISIAIGNGTLTSVSGDNQLVARDLGGFHLVKRFTSGPVGFLADGNFYVTGVLAFAKAPAA